MTKKSGAAKAVKNVDEKAAAAAASAHAEAVDGIDIHPEFGVPIGVPLTFEQSARVDRIIRRRVVGG